MSSLAHGDLTHVPTAAVPPSISSTLRGMLSPLPRLDAFPTMHDEASLRTVRAAVSMSASITECVVRLSERPSVHACLRACAPLARARTSIAERASRTRHAHTSSVHPFRRQPRAPATLSRAPNLTLSVCPGCSLAARCFAPEGSAVANDAKGGHPSLRVQIRRGSATRLSSLGEWRQHMRWYATIVEQKSSAADGQLGALPSVPPIATASASSTERLFQARGGLGGRCASAARDPDVQLRTVRNAYLEELRRIDRALQHIHPTFAQSPEVCTAELARQRHREVRSLQSAAIAINLELSFYVRLPESVGRRHLPTHAAPLLPRPLARQLRLLAGDPRGPARGVGEVAEWLGVGRASEADVLELLDRIERAAEIWQLKSEILLGIVHQGSGGKAGGGGKAGSAVAGRPTLERRSSASAAGMGSAPWLGAANGGHADGLERTGTARLPPPATGRANSLRPSRLARLLGMASAKQLGAHADGKAVAARALALEIRRLHPGLPQSGLEKAKVAHNRSVANAMLEAYSRALAYHSQSAVSLYHALASAGSVSAPMGRLPHAQSSAAAAPAALAVASMRPAVDELAGTLGRAAGLSSPASSSVSHLATAHPVALAASAGTGSPSATSPARDLVARTPALPLSGLRQTSAASTASAAAAASPAGSASLNFSRSTGRGAAEYKWRVRREEITMEARLGAGAYGVVWAGMWRRNEVAIKQMATGKLTEDDTDTFFAEMQLLSELRHENIVRFLGACLEPASMAILFELCPGSLYDLLYKDADEQLPPQPHLLNMLREVALGMHYLHCFEPPVLHLDLKSANVLLDYNGVAKVCDFGLAHVMEDAAAIPEDLPEGHKSSMGSPQWMAPEVLRGGFYDAKADIYSYGILLYEVMARQLPYPGVDTCEIVIGVITRLLPRPQLTAEVQSLWPAAMPCMMETCIDENASQRPLFASILDTLETVAPRDRRTTLLGMGANLGVSPRSAALGVGRPVGSPPAAFGIAPAQAPSQASSQRTSLVGGSEDGTVVGLAEHADERASLRKVGEGTGSANEEEAIPVMVRSHSMAVGRRQIAALRQTIQASPRDGKEWKAELATISSASPRGCLAGVESPVRVSWKVEDPAAAAFTAEVNPGVDMAADGVTDGVEEHGRTVIATELRPSSAGDATSAARASNGQPSPQGFAKLDGTWHSPEPTLSAPTETRTSPSMAPLTIVTPSPTAGRSRPPASTLPATSLSPTGDATLTGDSRGVQRVALRMGAPQHLKVTVPQADRSKGGNVFVVALELGAAVGSERIGQ